MSDWFEVWVDESVEPPYVLFVSPSDGGFVVRDPLERGAVVFRAHTYQEVKLWLLEDEYILVTGRMEPDNDEL